MTRDGIAPEELLSLFTVAANPLAKGEARSFVVVEGMDWNVSACEKCVGAIYGNREVGFVSDVSLLLILIKDWTLITVFLTKLKWKMRKAYT